VATGEPHVEDDRVVLVDGHRLLRAACIARDVDCEPLLAEAALERHRRGLLVLHHEDLHATLRLMSTIVLLYTDESAMRAGVAHRVRRA
jgi:hypothetical protein